MHLYRTHHSSNQCPTFATECDLLTNHHNHNRSPSGTHPSQSCTFPFKAASLPTESLMQTAVHLLPIVDTAGTGLTHQHVPRPFSHSPPERVSHITSCLIEPQARFRSVGRARICLSCAWERPPSTKKISGEDPALRNASARLLGKCSLIIGVSRSFLCSSLHCLFLGSSSRPPPYCAHFPPLPTISPRPLRHCYPLRIPPSVPLGKASPPQLGFCHRNPTHSNKMGIPNRQNQGFLSHVGQVWDSDETGVPMMGAAHTNVSPRVT